MSFSTLKTNTVDACNFTKEELYGVIRANECTYVTGCFETDPTGEKEQIENRRVTLNFLKMLNINEVKQANPEARIYILGLKKSEPLNKELLAKNKLEFTRGGWPAGALRPEMMIVVKRLVTGKDHLELSGMNFIPSNFGKDQFRTTLSLPGLETLEMSTGETLIQAGVKGVNSVILPAKCIPDPDDFAKKASRQGIVVDVAERTVNGISYKDSFESFIEGYNQTVRTIMRGANEKEAKALGNILALSPEYFVQAKGTSIPIGQLGSVEFKQVIAVSYTHLTLPTKRIV